MANATLAQRIQDLVGFDYSDNSINTEDEAIQTAFAEVIDLLPDSLLLKYAVAPKDLITGNDNMEIEGKKILRVIRFEGSPIVARVCEKVDIDTFKEITVDANSIYLPTNHSPVWTEDPATGVTKLEVFPRVTGTADAAESAKVYFISYLGDVADEDGTSNFNSFGIPHEADHAIALKASTYILQTMMSDTIQDDEDDEMLKMQQAQLASLEKMYQLEMQRLTGEKGEQ